MHLKKTVIEGKKKLDFSEYYEIQLWDMRTPKTPFKNTLNQLSSPNMTYKSGLFWKVVSLVKSVFVPVAIVSSLSLLILLVSALDNRFSPDIPCDNECKITLVESIPENLTFPQNSPIFPSTFSAWKTLLNDAQKSINLAVFYWSMKNEDVTPIKMPSALQGEEIFQQLLDIGKTKDVKIRVAQNAPTERFPQNNSRLLEQEGTAEVRSLDFERLLGAGVLHTKMWTVDGAHLYLGSANMDWQSLTQVKEVGVLIQNCSCLVQDMNKVFEVYWILGKNSSKIPPSWPLDLETKYNAENPMTLPLEGQNANVFVSSSPLPLNPLGRTNDVDAIVSIIRSAEKYVHIAVMDYFPRMLYSEKNTFWPVIDNELRRAALERKVEVRVLASHWNHTRSDMVRWLKSLQDISGQTHPSISVETKLFVVPAYTELQRELPFARVNHNKYMVTDKTAYVGTSNWSGDYFTNTAGVSLIISEEKGNGFRKENTERESDFNFRNESTFREQLENLFQRDWNSSYAKPVEQFLEA